MIFLRYEDRLPSVALVQRLINKCRELDSRLAGVPELKEDGIYLRATYDAVNAVQRALNILPQNGEFRPELWRALADIAKWRIVDVCDTAVEGLMTELGGPAQFRAKLARDYQQANPGKSVALIESAVNHSMNYYNNEISLYRSLVARLACQGGMPIELNSTSGVYAKIRNGIERRSRGGWKVVLVRLQSHGSPASQGVAGSQFHRGSIRRDDLSIDANDTIDEVIRSVVISGAFVPMAQFGCVELHGCNIAARRRRRNGPAFVREFAASIGRPVSACVNSNQFGYIETDVRLEPPVVSAVPSGHSIKQWFDMH